jgi:hypothetical protein
MSEAYPWIHLIDNRQSVFQGPFNPMSIEVRKEFKESLSRDPDARMFALDYTLYGSNGFVSDGAAGRVEQIDDSEYEVALPYRRRLLGRSSLQTVHVELPEAVNYITDSAALHRFAAVMAVAEAVNDNRAFAHAART